MCAGRHKTSPAGPSGSARGRASLPPHCKSDAGPRCGRRRPHLCDLTFSSTFLSAHVCLTCPLALMACPLHACKRLTRVVGDTDERTAICSWIAAVGSSPVTGDSLTDRGVWPNRSLRWLIDVWKVRFQIYVIHVLKEEMQETKNLQGLHFLVNALHTLAIAAVKAADSVCPAYCRCTRIKQAIFRPRYVSCMGKDQTGRLAVACCLAS